MVRRDLPPLCDRVRNERSAAARSGAQRFRRLRARAGQITVLGDGTPWRPLIDVGDMARAIDWAIERPQRGAPFLAINAGSDDWNYQVKDLANAVAKACPADGSVDQHVRARHSLLQGRLRAVPRAGARSSAAGRPVRGDRGPLGRPQRMGFADPDFRTSRLVRLGCSTTSPRRPRDRKARMGRARPCRPWLSAASAPRRCAHLRRSRHLAAREFVPEPGAAARESPSIPSTPTSASAACWCSSRSRAPEDIFSDYAYFSSVLRELGGARPRATSTSMPRARPRPESLVVEVASNDGYLLQ